MSVSVIERRVERDGRGSTRDIRGAEQMKTRKERCHDEIVKRVMRLDTRPRLLRRLMLGRTKTVTNDEGASWGELSLN